MAQTDVSEVYKRFESLKMERTSWESLWKDIRDFILPDAGNFIGDNARDGEKRFGKVLDAEATHCADIIAAGLLTGVSSPTRPWLRLTTLDAELDEGQEVKEWLSKTEAKMLMLLAKAEVYNPLHQSYLELPVFGTACTLIRPHPTRVIALDNLTVGEYYLADNEFGKIDTLYRQFTMTVKQMVAAFGYHNVSESVRNDYDQGKVFELKDVVHAIEPRFDRDIGKRDNLNMPWKSVYFELDQAGKGKILSESGFRDFPALCPRWFVNAHSVYGRGPGAKALSAAKRLQQHTDRFDLLTDYATDPPIIYPASQVGMKKNIRPGGRIAVAGPTDAQSIHSAWDVKTDPAFLQAQIENDYKQIRRFFHADTFQMIANTARDDRTAREVVALEQEKIMMLGPVLSRLHSEMLDPMVSNLFAMMVEMDMLDDPPEEIRGKDLNVEYISILAKQQKASASEGVGRFLQSIGAISQLDQSALDKLDVDKAVDHIADYEGVPPDMVVSGHKVALIRQARAQQQQQVEMLQQQQLQAETLRSLGQATDSQGGQMLMQQALP